MTTSDHPLCSAKVLNSSEDAHTKSISAFKIDEHLRAFLA